MQLEIFVSGFNQQITLGADLVMNLAAIGVETYWSTGGTSSCTTVMDSSEMPTAADSSFAVSRGCEAYAILLVVVSLASNFRW